MMGNYFVMSTRFNKSKASDFGLISKDANTAINPNDNSIWIRTALYEEIILRQYSRNLIFDALDDKKENGFYKSPLPNFDILLDLALNSKSRDDMYGAAAMILENFADELLCQCETLINDRSRKKEFKRLVELFKLKSATNRCSVVRKTYEQVKSDYCRWKKISDIANKM